MITVPIVFVVFDEPLWLVKLLLSKVFCLVFGFDARLVALLVLEIVFVFVKVFAAGIVEFEETVASTPLRLLIGKC